MPSLTRGERGLGSCEGLLRPKPKTQSGDGNAWNWEKHVPFLVSQWTWEVTYITQWSSELQPAPILVSRPLPDLPLPHLNRGLTQLQKLNTNL